ncbi:hypothetical protein DCS_02366 [Drechmeria coniospora]|uniref:AA1-like domain-containing protein n=1 Tax=Drechmeria coniospora TaxID=98403 RepID=A0A151GVT7_DRECN|nr:hypothetical protein DCS_02366 [Drechmeria coniospora]KYK61225.1 hypothetical protein DCS_02366 [Drechmeria coniospora]
MLLAAVVNALLVVPVAFASSPPLPKPVLVEPKKVVDPGKPLPEIAIDPTEGLPIVVDPGQVQPQVQPPVGEPIKVVDPVPPKPQVQPPVGEPIKVVDPVPPKPQVQPPVGEPITMVDPVPPQPQIQPPVGEPIKVVDQKVVDPKLVSPQGAGPSESVHVRGFVGKLTSIVGKSNTLDASFIIKPDIGKVIKCSVKDQPSTQSGDTLSRCEDTTYQFQIAVASDYEHFRVRVFHETTSGVKLSKSGTVPTKKCEAVGKILKDRAVKACKQYQPLPLSLVKDG